ncbi:SUMF1/EgtB/PvdO family nonheme iron enzyme [Sorangium sp. So ce204]|uniref:SUMF1/EgtB/PvdO family nonheme iron enzyme n=1 Tax=Sorangium sp. So ce204 TaxID=3133288 RepID=UPI003F62F4B2
MNHGAEHGKRGARSTRDGRPDTLFDEEPAMRSGALPLAALLTSLLGLVAVVSAACDGGLGAGMDDSAGGGGAAASSSSSSSASVTSGGGSGAGDGGGSGEGGIGGGSGGTDEQDFPLDTTPPAPCPPDMAEVQGYCVDRFEAPNVEGALPLVMESAVSARAWCEARGKRLCTEDEWDTACQGPEAFVYPYGNTHEAERCNDNKTWRAPDEGALGSWPSDEALAEVQALYQAEPSGSRPGCASAFGVHDMTGNVEDVGGAHPIPRQRVSSRPQGLLLVRLLRRREAAVRLHEPGARGRVPLLRDRLPVLP